VEYYQRDLALVHARGFGQHAALSVAMASCPVVVAAMAPGLMTSTWGPATAAVAASAPTHRDVSIPAISSPLSTETTQRRDGWPGGQEIMRIARAKASLRSR
jgi:hypothetical protein